MIEQLRARVRRWWYLLTVGGGESAVDLYDERGRCQVLGSGRRLAVGVYANYRIWWQCKERTR